MSTVENPSRPEVEKENYQRLKHLREEERHEILWVAQRLGWLLTSEAFLLSAAVVTQSKDYEGWWYGTAATFILGILGVWLAIKGSSDNSVLGTVQSEEHAVS